MVDLRPKPKQDPAPYDIGSKASQPFMKSRERFKMLLLAVAMTVAVAALWMGGNDTDTQAGAQNSLFAQAEDLELSPMDLPDLSKLPALPSYDPTIIGLASDVAHINNNPDDLPILMGGGLTATTVAWARSQIMDDRQQPPVPQAFEARDLVFGKVTMGVPIMLSGTVLAKADAAITNVGPGVDEAWVHYTVMIDEEHNQFAHIIAPQWALGDEESAEGPQAGEPVRLVGRYVGVQRFATLKGGAGQKMPVVAARRIRTRDDQSGKITNLLNLSPLEEHHQQFRRDPTVYDTINDTLPVLELRPYYYTIGHVKADISTPGVYDNPQSASELCAQLHKRPKDFRGQVFTVDGTVKDVADDYQVSLDKPYGTDRIIRIRLYKTIIGVEHEEQFAGEVTTHKRAVMHGFELAVLAHADTPSPKPGDRVQATGRFVKVRGYKMDVNPIQDAINNFQRQSENVYFKFFVVPDMEIIKPQRFNDFWFRVVFTIVALSFGTMMGVLIHKDETTSDDYKRNVRKLRRQRRQLRKDDKLHKRKDGDDDQHSEPDKPTKTTEMERE